jgi:hypothetical protein
MLAVYTSTITATATSGRLPSLVEPRHEFIDGISHGAVAQTDEPGTPTFLAPPGEGASRDPEEVGGLCRGEEMQTRH